MALFDSTPLRVVFVVSAREPSALTCRISVIAPGLKFHVDASVSGNLEYKLRADSLLESGCLCRDRVHARVRDSERRTFHHWS